MISSGVWRRTLRTPRARRPQTASQSRRRRACGARRVASRVPSRAIGVHIWRRWLCRRRSSIISRRSAPAARETSPAARRLDISPARSSICRRSGCAQASTAPTPGAAPVGMRRRPGSRTRSAPRPSTGRVALGLLVSYQPFLCGLPAVRLAGRVSTGRWPLLPGRRGPRAVPGRDSRPDHRGAGRPLRRDRRPRRRQAAVAVLRRHRAGDVLLAAR